MEVLVLFIVIFLGVQIGKVLFMRTRHRPDDPMALMQELQDSARRMRSLGIPSREQTRAHQDRLLAALGEPDRDWHDPREWVALDETIRQQIRQFASDNVPTVALFGTGSHRSDELLRDIGILATDLGFGIVKPTDTSPYSVRESLRSADITLIDCTMEPASSYEAVQYAFYSKYLVPISSSALPVNMPTWLPVAPTYPIEWSRSMLLSETRGRLGELIADCPRTTSPDGYRSEAELSRESNAAMAFAAERRRDEGQIFVSYRGHHAKGVADWLDENSAPWGSPKSVKVFSSGELAPDGELMTEQRRWQVHRQLLQWIKTAEEFLIYHSDDYYDSWWTRAELLALSMLKDIPPIYSIDASTGDRTQIAIDELVTEPTIDEMAQLTSLHVFAFAPEWLHRMNQPFSELIPPVAHNLYSDEVAQRLLGTERWIQCSRCQPVRAHPRKGLLPLTGTRGRSSTIVASDLLQLAHPSLQTVDISAERQSATCTACGAEYSIEHEGKISWWYPFREFPDGEERCTGPSDRCLEHQDVWRFADDGRPATMETQL